MSKSNNLTTISITHENYNILRKMGHTGESFNDVITKILREKLGKTQNE